MNDTSLPTEILAAIIGNLIAEDPSATPENLSNVKYIPRSYLKPLLRVSKRWYAISVGHLYQSMGSDKQETAEVLYRMLQTNSQRASRVERLHLGIEGNRNSYIEQTQTNINILQLCPNLKHVEICGFANQKLDALVEALKTKSLVSFCVSQRDIPSHAPAEGITFSQLCDVMQKWPRLRCIQVERISTTARNQRALSSFQLSGCCPDLREIVTYRAALHASEYTTLRSMCISGVRKFAISLFDLKDKNHLFGKGTLNALCECLRAWSPTLQHLKIDAYVMDYLNSYRPLDEAIATLGELRELQIGRMKMDLGLISNLPRLERVACLSHFTEEEIQPLPTYLEDLGKFPSLSHIVLSLDRQEQLGERLQDVCRRRNIQLHEYEIDRRSWITVCPIIDVFSGSVDWH